MIIPNIWENKDVPNHQPVMFYESKESMTFIEFIKHRNDFLLFLGHDLQYETRSKSMTIMLPPKPVRCK